MPTTPLEPDSQRSEKRRIIIVLALAAAFPAVLMLISATGRPELGLVLIAVVFPALFVIGRLRGRRTREGTDERAWDNHRRAASFSLQVTALALGGTVVWMLARHGHRAAEPYVYLTAVLTLSYVCASLWRRWRGY